MRSPASTMRTTGSTCVSGIDLGVAKITGITAYERMIRREYGD